MFNCLTNNTAMISTNVLCVKKRKKRRYYVSNVSDYAGKYRKDKSRIMMQITEDTPPDLLAGAMNLQVHLPNGTTKKMSFERSTPMMDVLVQITNANQLQISGFILQPMAIVSEGSKTAKVLPYLPNTPIGTLDTCELKVSPKNHKINHKQQQGKPFETTFRLKVHLPRNQLYVDRVSPNITLEEVMKKMCEEKNLDPQKFQFRHPNNLDQVLDLSRKLSDYGINEIRVFPKESLSQQVFASSESLMEFRDQKTVPKKGPIGTGLFNFFKRSSTKISQNNAINESGSISSENRSISPTQSDEPNVDKPKVPTRKRRPAPKPPSKTAEEQLSEECRSHSLTINHSRNSSDSSGYHESSVLSDTGGTLTKKTPSNKLGGSLMLAMKIHSKSTSNISATGRKKKAPPPPPTTAFRKSATCISLSDPLTSTVASPAPSTTVVASPPQDEIVEEVCTASVSAESSTPPPPLVEETVEIVKESPIVVTQLSVPDAVDSDTIQEEPINLAPDEDIDWQYELPSPPKDFRDVTPPSAQCEENKSQSTVLASPELLDKLNSIKSASVKSTDSNEEKSFLDNMSLENLEKRRSLVYNRELATSFKSEEEKDVLSKKDQVIDELEKTISNGSPIVKKNDSNNNVNGSINNFSTHLPNFKITTYDDEKEKHFQKIVNIFEDDSIRSSHKNQRNASAYSKTLERGESLQRSESLSNWFPSNVPIKRSKSQITLKSHGKTVVSSPTLQSPEILKAIQNKLTENHRNSFEVPQQPKIINEMGSVVIKIPPAPKDNSMQRFIHHTTATGYKKPQKDESLKRQSIAEEEPEVHKLPIVRSVELKKTFRSDSTSCTYLNGDNTFDVKSSNINSPGCPRDTLLLAIRNFGGKKGLKSVKVQ